jgi:hypothetical protein
MEAMGSAPAPGVPARPNDRTDFGRIVPPNPPVEASTKNHDREPGFSKSDWTAVKGIEIAAMLTAAKDILPRDPEELP